MSLPLRQQTPDPFPELTSSPISPFDPTTASKSHPNSPSSSRQRDHVAAPRKISAPVAPPQINEEILNDEARLFMIIPASHTIITLNHECVMISRFAVSLKMSVMISFHHSYCFSTTVVLIRLYLLVLVRDAVCIFGLDKG